MPTSISLEHGRNNFKCSWPITQAPKAYSRDRSWRSVDITVQKTSQASSKAGAGLQLPCSSTHCGEDATRHTRLDSFVNGKSKDFLSVLLSAAASAPVGRARAAKLILPRSAGFIVRSDIIPMRMHGCANLLHVTSLAYPQQWFAGDECIEQESESLERLFLAAAGALILDTGEGIAEMLSDLKAFEVILERRLSFPWILKETRPKQTLAFVGNYLRCPGHGGTGANHYSAAIALDISIVLLDAPGCWLQSPEYAHLRAAFLPVDLTRDDGLFGRIMNALSQYKGHLDGIVTFHESLSVAVAMVAEQLSLPTASPMAQDVAADKYKTSVADGRTADLVSNMEDAFAISQNPDLQYPLILKPCRGWGSEGVYKLDDASEFADAIKASASVSDRHGSRFVIESYCDGPEVDVNMVLCGGELLFSEIADDFPKLGDRTPAGNSSSFLELTTVYPSRLPSSELSMLSNSLHKTLVRLGFHTGVFHLEARVKDSAMLYVVHDGILDLEYRTQTSHTATPSSWLIEINARPPGNASSDAVERTYGIDYVGLGLLVGLNDQERIRALCYPFSQGAQYWCQSVFFPAEKGGTFDSQDICEDLRRRRPDLAQHISKCLCYVQKGERIPPPSAGISVWIARFTIFSRQSRAHLLQISESIRREVRYSIV